jgi:hypothetical protein
MGQPLGMTQRPVSRLETSKTSAPDLPARQHSAPNWLRGSSDAATDTEGAVFLGMVSFVMPARPGVP